MDWIIARLKEPSTHNAIATLALATVPFFGPYAALATAVFGVLGIVTKEGNS